MNRVSEIDSKIVFKELGKEGVCIIDVRTAEEFSRGHIDGSINVPIQNLKEEIASFLADKSMKIYAYCLSGSRSNIAVFELIKMGYKNSFSMTSGLLAWRANKFPLVN